MIIENNTSKGDDKLKDKIVFLIIGLLIGAIITTGGFIVYNKRTTKNCENIVTEGHNNSNRHPEMSGKMPDNMAGEPPTNPEGEPETRVQPKMPEGTIDQSPKTSKPQRNNVTQEEST